MTADHRLRSVAVVVDNGVSPFEFATVCEVFGIDRSQQGLPAFDFASARRDRARSVPAWVSS